MQPDLEKRLAAQELKLEAVWQSVEKTRKILMWTGIITIAAIVLPLIGLLFAIPAFLSQIDLYSGFLQFMQS